MADIFVLEDKKVVHKAFSAKTLQENLRKNLLWIDIGENQKEIFEILSVVYKFHPLVVEDAVLVTKTLPKIEEFRSYDFIITYSLSLNKKIITAVELDFFIGKNFVISSHHEEIPSFQKLKRNISKLTSLMKHGPNFLLHMLIDLEVDKQLLVVEDAGDILDETSSKMVSRHGANMISSLFHSKRELTKVKKILLFQSQVIDSLSKKPVKFFIDDVKPYFRDTYDHLLRILDMVESQREVIDNNIQIHFAMMSSKMNEIIKVLTIIATIVLPLTLISSIYGMNFKYMPELSSPYGYPAVIGAMLLLAICMMIYFKKKRWV